MKYIKTALLSVLGASLLYSCEPKEPSFGDGTGEVNFTTQSITIDENSGFFTAPLDLTGDPGGYPVTVKITASGVDDIDEVLLITSLTVKITEENNSYVQMTPVWNPKSNDDYTVTLTIESINGAKIGAVNTCTVNIQNIPAVQLGQYSFNSPAGTPEDWTLILREGVNGTYIMDNMLDIEDSPKLVGEFDPETMQLVFDGRVNGFGEVNFNGQLGWGQRGTDYLAFNSSNPIVFNVTEDYYLLDTQSELLFFLVKINDAGQQEGAPITLGSFKGGTCEYAGEVSKPEWPF